MPAKTEFLFDPSTVFFNYLSHLFWIQWFPKTKLTILGSQISACFAKGQWAEKTIHGCRHSLYSKCYFFGFSFCKTNFCNFSLASERNNRQRYELWTAFIKEVPFCTSFLPQRCAWINFRSMKFYCWTMFFCLCCCSMLQAVLDSATERSVTLPCQRRDQTVRLLVFVLKYCCNILETNLVKWIVSANCILP